MRISSQDTQKRNRISAFTLVETMITIAVIAILAGIVSFAAVSVQKDARDSVRNNKAQILSKALEKYYEENGEYPSVAAMTGSNIDTLKAKLKITDADIFKLPGSTVANSLATSSPSTTKLVYTANTTDTTKNSQCQTSPSGYCDGYTLQYIKESGEVVTLTGLHTTFVAVSSNQTCNPGDTQSGTTCTHTYPGTYQTGAYGCPSGGTLSGTTCTSTYTASYSSGGGYYYCPSGGSLSGTTCTTTTSYKASGTYYCPPGYGKMTWQQDMYVCYACTKYSSGTGSACMIYGGGTVPAGYSTQQLTCPNGGTLSGANCVSTTSYGATYYSYSGYYYCSGSDTLSGSTCTRTYAASPGSGYYTCPNGGTASGSTCSYTYELQG